MKKVNVVTYCTETSYGSIYQALGLKHALLEIGCKSCILQPENQPEAVYKNKLQGTLSVKKIMVFISQQLILPKLQKKYYFTNKFINQHLDIEYFGNYNNLCANVTRDELYIAGSDQIWNPLHIRPEFFLRFLPEGVKKISYAASMGVLQIPPRNQTIFEEYVNDFDVVSVREKECAELMAGFVKQKIHTNIDPTFLIKRDLWDDYCREYPVCQKYILVYPLYWNKKYNSMLKQLHKKTGLTIIVVAQNHRDVYANRWIFDADPGQLLWLIKNAEAVVSSSFHGVAMSLIFGRKVAAIINPNAPSRICSLLETLDYPKLSITDLGYETVIDADHIAERIKSERMKGLSFLQEAIESDEQY